MTFLRELYLCLGDADADADADNYHWKERRLRVDGGRASSLDFGFESSFSRPLGNLSGGMPTGTQTPLFPRAQCSGSLCSPPPLLRPLTFHDSFLLAQPSSHPAQPSTSWQTYATRSSSTTNSWLFDSFETRSLTLRIPLGRKPRGHLPTVKLASAAHPPIHPRRCMGMTSRLRTTSLNGFLPFPSPRDLNIRSPSTCMPQHYPYLA